MAKKFTKKRSRKVAFKTAKRLGKKSRLSVPRNMVSTGTGFPKKLLMTHKYSEVVSLVNTSGAYNNYVMSANGLFDPNITGTGHQPMYFDQLTALYNHYVVIGSKCTFTFTPSAVTTSTIRCAALVDDNATLSVGNLDANSEATLAKRVIILPAGNNSVGKRTLKFSSKKTFGKGAMANSNLRGSATANPAEQAYFFFCSSGDAVVTTTLIIQVEITYSTIWFELKDLNSS